MPTYEQVINAVREVTLDRFPQPAFFIRKNENYAGSDLALYVDDEKLSLVEADKVSTLAKLSLNGKSLENFSPEKLNYVVYVNYTQPITFTFNKTVSTQTVTQANSEIVADYHTRYTFEVTSGDASTSQTYTVDVYRYQQNDIKQMFLNGVSTPYFISKPEQVLASPVTIYVPEDFEDLTSVQITPQDPAQNPIVSINSTTSFAVTINGDTRTFNLVKTECPYIKNLKVNGEYVEGFSPSKNTYTVKTPITYTDPLTVEFSPFIDNDSRCEYEVTFTSTLITIFVKDLSGNILSFYSITIDYVEGNYYHNMLPFEKYSFPFEEYPTFDDLGRALRDLTDKPLDVDWWPTIKGSEPSEFLTNVNYRPITSEAAIIERDRFFTDTHYENLIKEYFRYYYGRYYSDAEISDKILSSPDDLLMHIVLYVGFFAIEDRRAEELAVEALLGGADNLDLKFGDGSSTYGAQRNMNSRIQVQIGSVFTLEDGGPDYSANKKPGGPGAQVGADNVLGDEDTFWWRLQSHLRKRFEDVFRDYALRSNEVIEGRSDLVPIRDTNFMAFFDSYPYTLSPMARGIMAGGRAINDTSAVFAASSNFNAI